MLDMVGNPKDRFSRLGAHLLCMSMKFCKQNDVPETSEE